MVDLDELERLHKELPTKPWKSDDPAIFTRGEGNKAVPFPFIAAIKNACDDGLLEQLRTAEEDLRKFRKWHGETGPAMLALKAELDETKRERDEARAQTSAVAKVLNDAPPYQASLAKRAEELIHHLEVNDARLAALKAENERLRALLRPIAQIAEWEADARPGESVFVNIDRCRDAHEELETTND